jgi:hypothetical protein
MAMLDKFKNYEGKDWIMAAVGLTTLIVTMILVISLASIKVESISDESIQTKVKNSRNSSYVIIFCMILTAVVGVLSPLKCKEAAPKQFLRYF